ncbi:MAG TPA: 6-phosphogluconolactonase [Acidocella sp.]|jgi:6-phosphogluconolactonase|nr:6-phosphogluconolactonase [Acidocella sp.]
MKRFSSREDLAEALAGHVATVLRQHLDHEERAVLAVSGGTTPARFLDLLSRKPLDWARVVVTLVDERWVDENAPRSNAALVRTHLLHGAAATARFLPLYNGAATPEEGAKKLDLPLPLTAAVLGMGEDGHTASFFPKGDHLTEALDPEGRAMVLPMHAPGAPEPRITLTLPVLLGADYLALHIEGDTKRLVLEKALVQGADLPVSAVLAARPGMDIYWSP